MYDSTQFKFKKEADAGFVTDAKLSSLREETESAENDFPIGYSQRTSAVPFTPDSTDSMAHAWKVSVYSNDDGTLPYLTVYKPILIIDGITYECPDNAMNGATEGFYSLGAAFDKSGGEGALKEKGGILYCRLIYDVSSEEVDGETVKSYTFNSSLLIFAPDEHEKAPDDEKWIDIPICELSHDNARMIRQIQAGAIIYNIGGGGGGSAAAIEDPRVYVTKIGNEIWLTQGEEVEEQEIEGCTETKKVYKPLHKILRLDSILWQTAMVDMTGECGNYCALITSRFDWDSCTLLSGSQGKGQTDVYIDGSTAYNKSPTGGDGELLRGYGVTWQNPLCVKYPTDDTQQGCVAGAATCGLLFSNAEPAITAETVYFYTELADVNAAGSTYSTARISEDDELI